MDKNEYRVILIQDLKERGYKWETVRAKGGGEIPLSRASIPQLKAIKNSMIEGRTKKLTPKHQRIEHTEKAIQLNFDF